MSNQEADKKPQDNAADLGRDFQTVLRRICDHLAPQDTRQLKTLLKEDPIISRWFPGDLSLESPSELVLKLQINRIITADNPLLLTSLLWRLRRDDLIKLLLQNAETLSDQIHCDMPSEKPAKGFRQLALILRASLKDINRSTMEAFRSHLARAVGIPPEYAFLDGIHPDLDDRTIMTIQIPASCMERAAFVLRNDAVRRELMANGVEAIRLSREDEIRLTYETKDEEPPTAENLTVLASNKCCADVRKELILQLEATGGLRQEVERLRLENSRLQNYHDASLGRESNLRKMLQDRLAKSEEDAEAMKMLTKKVEDSLKKKECLESEIADLRKLVTKTTHIDLSTPLKNAFGGVGSSGIHTQSAIGKDGETKTKPRAQSQAKANQSRVSQPSGRHNTSL
ncbi:Hypp8587 [Branchiostoma lanceolatum]|uniref:Hypp8587 protein n=1 Tax=Branchiostoma lanceolatum TaxID=7740 RepID=A0A8J9Z7Q5_BRALA|nr:Hypp8587 [Branchiostoma lanceolatum]